MKFNNILGKIMIFKFVKMYFKKRDRIFVHEIRNYPSRMVLVATTLHEI